VTGKVRTVLSAGTLRWLADATPPAPAAFRPWLGGAVGSPARGTSRADHEESGRTSDGETQRVAELAAAGCAALGAASDAKEEGRAVAFRLLEADALLTYACEAAAETPEPESALLEVLRGAAGAAR
jgi:hypothetical protein